MQILKSYHSPKIEIRDSSVAGVGSFAKENISVGEIVAVKGGYILTLEDIKKRDDPMLEGAVWPLSDDLYLGPAEESQIKDIRVRVNHSCDPNCGIVGQVVFMAMRGISAGEEITQDYAQIDGGMIDYKMPCNCGAPDCRGTISSKDWHYPKLQRKYSGFFAVYLQQKINAVKKESAKTGLPEWLFWACGKIAGNFSDGDIAALSAKLSRNYYIGKDGYVWQKSGGPAGRQIRIETLCKEYVANYR